MKRTISLILAFALIFSMLLALSSCGARSNHYEYIPTPEEIADLFTSNGYKVSINKVFSSWENGPYRSVKADNPEKNHHLYDNLIHIIFYPNSIDVKRYADEYYSNRRTILNEILYYFIGAEDYTSVAYTDTMIILYTYKEDLHILLDYMEKMG